MLCIASIIVPIVWDVIDALNLLALIPGAGAGIAAIADVIGLIISLVIYKKYGWWYLIELLVDLLALISIVALPVSVGTIVVINIFPTMTLVHFIATSGRMRRTF